jgi:transposase-like protein|tara:strand:+ start:247 stop:1458 length:1212 start_codon:yes stop_codon:yes gene_type:complete
MTHIQDKSIEGITEVLMKNGFEKAVPEIMEILLNAAMRAERDTFLKAGPYERTDDRRDVANGFKPKQLKTRYGTLALEIPQTRTTDFYPSCLEKGLRSERALNCTMAEMYIQGVSTRKVTKILTTMCGLEVSSTQVSRCAQQLDESLEAWRNRPLDAFSYVILDARYEDVRYGGSVRKLAVIWGIGITKEGRREILGMSVSLSESEIHWRTFLKSLTARGLSGVHYIVSDDHQGLKSALQTVFPGVMWNRCHTHLARNAQGYVSRKTHKADVASDIRDILQAPDQQTAHYLLDRFTKSWQKKEPKLVEWAGLNIPEGFNVFNLPKGIQKKLRTSNLIERLNQELKRRSRVVRIFPNEAACLRLLSAVALEIHEDWLTGRRFFSEDILLDLQAIGNGIYRKKVA